MLMHELDEIIEENVEENVEEMLKNITLGGTEFRYNIKKHKHITENGSENSTRV